MTWYNVLIVVGVPSIFTVIWQLIFKKIEQKTDDRRILYRSIQALLRDRLMTEYKYHMANGQISMADRDNYENMYSCYHNLGKNGVMTKYYDEVMNLPVATLSVHTNQA